MRVLIALDELNCANEVINFVTEHNWEDNSEFSLINVVAPITLDMPLASYPTFLESISQAAQEEGRFILKTAAKKLQDKHCLNVHTELMIGHPSQVIVSHAKEWKADLIIMGSHGRKGVEKFFYGSVSEDISGAAPCSVLVLRLPDPVAASRKEQAAGAVEDSVLNKSAS